jgi:hypothetical protein
MTCVTGLNMLDAVFKGHGWGVVYVLAGGDGNVCSVISDIDRDRPRRSKRPPRRSTSPRSIKSSGTPSTRTEPFKSIETGVLPYTGIATWAR